MRLELHLRIDDNNMKQILFTKQDTMIVFKDLLISLLIIILKIRKPIDIN